ncbi:MAG: methylated DNA-protein cysteine methyltransferase [Eubacteriales bacterium]
MAKKTFNEKLNFTGDLPKIENLNKKPELVARYKAATMLIAAPIQYNEVMAKVPKNKLITIDKIREHLARKEGADITCPLTAGIFINICANAAVEREDKNFPWWRTLKAKGELNEKYPGGYDNQKLKLIMDGFEIVQKGKKYFVKDFEKYLWDIT